MPEFISYLRVSTQRQGHNGLGVEAQRAAVDTYIRGIGGTLLQEYVEVESGAAKNRPVLVQSIAHCRQTKGTLIIAKLDRLARNVAFVSALMETGIEFVAVDAPFANRLFVHILSAFAEHERTMISERTKAALAAAKARGVILGANGRRLAAQHKADAVSFAENLRPDIARITNEGAETLAQIARRLNFEGFRTRESAPWSPAAVQRVLIRLGVATAAMNASAKPRGEVCSLSNAIA